MMILLVSDSERRGNTQISVFELLTTAHLICFLSKESCTHHRSSKTAPSTDMVGTESMLLRNPSSSFTIVTSPAEIWDAHSSVVVGLDSNWCKASRKIIVRHFPKSLPMTTRLVANRLSGS